MESFADMLGLARAYVRAGLSIIPVSPGTKIPAGGLLPLVFNEQKDREESSWKMFQERLPTEQELQRWFERGQVGIGIVGGTVSGGLVIIDLESDQYYEAWRERAEMLLSEDLLATLPLVATGKGRHVYFRMANPIGNRKLAKNGNTLFAETRGEGGYVLAPPTKHPSGAVYTLLQGDLLNIPLLSAADAQRLLDAARALAPADAHTDGSRRPYQRIIDMFNEAMTIEAVLEDAGYVADCSGRYIRPGGERSSVIILDNRSIHFNPSDPLYSESPNGGHHAQAPFSAWCLLNHSNDFRPAIRAAAELLHLDDFTIASDEQHTATAGTMLEEPYFDHDGQFWMRQYERDGSEKNPLLLCNFTAQIIAELQLDDGEQQEERYIIQATCRGRSKTIDLARVDFESENAVGRIVAKLGARARVNPRAQFRYILDAIKAFSTTVEEKVTYTHTGWAGERYLFGNGYVDANGWHETNGAKLPLRLRNYEIAPHGDMATALQLFDELLKLAPSEVMVPLIGGILLAPIHESVDAPAPMIHVYGPTGSYKTSISCAAMALWGNFTPAQPTDTWTSTGYSVQRLGWYLKDAPMLLDDYKAANVQPKQVIFLLQNYGDNMARGRLDANSDLRNLYPMRCVLLSSGEDQPEGEASTLARILSVPVARHDVDRKRLTIIQEQAELLSCVTVAYLTWIAAQRPALDHVSLHRTVRTELLAALEQGVTQQINPGRVASNAATIYTSWSCFCRFLTEQGHWSQARTDQWLRECKRGLLQLARAQLNLTAQERYSQLFLEAVRSLVASQRAVIMNIAQASPMLDSGQVLLGAADQHGTYLITGAAYDEVCKHLRSVGRPVSFSKRALAQMLHQDGLLLSVENGFDMKKRFGDGQRPRCWHLPADILDG